MTIASIIVYTPARGESTKLSRKWATKEEVREVREDLQEQIDTLKEHVNFLINSKEMTDQERRDET